MKGVMAALMGILPLVFMIKIVGAALPGGSTCVDMAGKGGISIQSANIGNGDSQGCTGYLLHTATGGDYRACGEMDDQAAEVACFEDGSNYFGRSKVFKCRYYHGSDRDDITLANTYLTLENLTRNAFQCPFADPDGEGPYHNCFLDCYDQGSTRFLTESATQCDSAKDIAVECVDINECLDGVFVFCDGPFDYQCENRPACGPHAVCTNGIATTLSQAFQCGCDLPGWNGAGSDAYDYEKGCLDTDECLNAQTCGPNSQCENTAGSYICLCDAGYDWDGSGCSILDCDAPSAFIPGGVLTSPAVPDEVDYNDVAIYTCNSGFRPKYGGPSAFHVNCRQDEKWCSCLTPSCKKQSCGPMVTDPNAHMEVSGTGVGVYGEEVDYDCASGFSSDYTRTCLREGLWSDGELCSDINECLNNPCPAHSQCYNTIGSYSCICDPGYTGDGTLGSACTALECGSIPTIGNAERITNLPTGVTVVNFNEVLDYRCQRGFESTLNRDERERVDVVTLVCRADGLWEPNPLPECVRISCGDPGLMNYATRSGGTFYYGDSVTYTCLDGYRPNDVVWAPNSVYRAISITCQADGTWTTSAFCEDVNECKEVTNPCGNANHYCINKKGSYQCSCTHGYRVDETGTNCVGHPVPVQGPEQLQPCEMYALLNVCPYGACLIAQNGRPYCQCNEGYYGTFCEDFGPKEGRGHNTSVVLILGISSLAVAAFLLIGITLIGLWLCFRSTNVVTVSPDNYGPKVYDPTGAGAASNGPWLGRW